MVASTRAPSAPQRSSRIAVRHKFLRLSMNLDASRATGVENGAKRPDALFQPRTYLPAALDASQVDHCWIQSLGTATMCAPSIAPWDQQTREAR
jgi:hypothetical protein